MNGAGKKAYYVYFDKTGKMKEMSKIAVTSKHDQYEVIQNTSY